MAANPPKIENAPGLTWRPRKNGWEARWQCRTDLAQRGYAIKSVGIWVGAEPPTDLETMTIQDRCNSLQAEMLVWGRDGLPQVSEFKGTVKSLIDCYQTDRDSPFRKLRYETRRFYRQLCKRIEADFGETLVADIKARQILHWHAGIKDEGKIAMAHALVGMFRTLCSFGSTFLEDDGCAKLSGVLSNMRFEMPKPRNERLTAEQAVLIRAQAHKAGWHSIAFAQALQFELFLRQKDVIGEWVPISENAPITDVLDGNNKWLRGIRWEEIDGTLRLTHITSKRQKLVDPDLKLAPMVMEELALIYGQGFTRADLPASGPIIINEKNGRPWLANEFRRWWRKIAKDAGVPVTVRNMDSRAGAISESTDAGADLEHVRHAATHSDIGMTQRYSRGSQDKVAGVMEKRVAHRNKTGTKEG
jgi:hypothetical protein